MQLQAFQGTTKQAAVITPGSSAESPAIISKIRKAGTMKHLGAYVSSNARTTTSTLRSRKNVANGNQTRSITSGATGWQEDTTNSDTIAANDDFAILLSTLTGTQNLIVEGLFISFESAAGEGYAHHGITVGNNLNFGQSWYLQLVGTTNVVVSTEADVQSTLRLGANHDFSTLGFFAATNTIDAATTVTFRVNGADTALAISVGAGGSGNFADTSDTVTVATGDSINYALVAGGTTGVMNYRYTSCHYVLAAGAAIERALATETVTLSDSRTRLAAKIRTRTDTAIAVGESRARLSAKNRPIATQTTALSENVIRIKGKIKTLATETITVTGGTIARLLAKIRTAGDTATISETRQRLGSKSRPLSTQTVALSESSQRIKGVIRALATQTITVGGGTVARLSSKIRALASQIVALSENRLRLKGGIRALATQSVILSESIARTVARQVIRALATQTVAISEGVARLKISQRTISQTIIIGETAARLSAKLRAIAAQTVTIADSVTRQIIGGAVEITRTLTQTVVLSDSVARRLSSLRALPETVPRAETLARVKGKVKLISQTIAIGEQAARIKSSLRLISQTVTISDSINRLNALRRTVSQTILLAENVAQETVDNLVRSLVETVTISDSIVRRTAKLVILGQTIAITEQARRLSTKLRTIPSQTISLTDSTTAELNVIIKNVIRTIGDIVGLTEHLQAFVIKVRDRFRYIREPSQKHPRILSNHPAWLLGSRGMHDNYEEFDG